MLLSSYHTIDITPWKVVSIVKLGWSVVRCARTSLPCTSSYHCFGIIGLWNLDREPKFAILAVRCSSSRILLLKVQNSKYTLLTMS